MTTTENADERTGAFTAAERDAMKERAAEVKQQQRASGQAHQTADVLAKIAEMTGDDRDLAEHVHAVVTEVAPGLAPKTWYGMPGYARAGKVVLFFQAAAKFQARYPTLGFNDTAALDDGAMWPTAFALTAWDDAVESRVRDLVARAAGDA